ncbi:Class B acid phosphatase [Ignavibacterium album JCM 16511]|uniref:Class B acid phosphatase n=1 Tax=Ignavibacterium album (strain DSM 19864 / JCM 16511 / NBRC 101810 / Mat9-16) TaxID=945713 RepID=I0AFW3_IGNAJ|nr:HAD family acid phosphatase [Ignavibacterium album]AFH47870.1 Class B acid phosphatase [Ignavibacterium album JCM 16511]
MKLFFFKNTLTSTRNLTLTLILSLTLLSCSSNELINLRVAKDRVKDYYESGKYDEELNKIYNEAKAQIEKIKIKDNSAAIFDVDDTALSNYEISKRLDYGYDFQIIQDWVMSAKLPAIKQTLEFYNYLKIKGVKLIFLTGRNIEEYDATYRNLIEQGYTDFDTLIVRSEQDRKLGAAQFKSQKRKELIQNGYEIIICVGDQWTDLEGDYTGIKVKLPNYLYETK